MNVSSHNTCMKILLTFHRQQLNCFKNKYEMFTVALVSNTVYLALCLKQISRMSTLATGSTTQM